MGDGNGWLLPVKQLKPGATYKATVVLAPQEGDVQRQFTHSWTLRASRATLDGDGYLYPLTRKQRKGCKRLPGWDRVTCLMGRRSAALR